MIATALLDVTLVPALLSAHTSRGSWVRGKVAGQ